MVGAMNTALVISQMPGSKEMIRSDMVAAKVLQNAIKEGRGEEVLSPRTSDARSKGAAAAEPPRVEALEKKPEAKQVPKEAPAVLVGASSLASIREKIVDMTKALEGLKAAFEAMSGYRSMIMESDSATAIAYAGNVLSNVEREAEVKQEAPSEEVGGCAPYFRRCRIGRDHFGGASGR